MRFRSAGNGQGGRIARGPSLLWLPALLLAAPASAQDRNDTVRLKEVEIIAPRLTTFAAGTKLQRVDSATLARYASSDLGELLSNASPVFVKSYGMGGLATTSFRGGSANHTAILWNGFNLGSPMNGMIDLSLIPVGTADEVSIQYGGGTALWGSGAVGGAIHLDNVPRFGRGLQVDGSAGFGSFGDRRQRIRTEMAKDRWITSIALYRTDAANDFTYTQRTDEGTSERTQTNAALDRYGLLAEQHFRIAPLQRISVRYWYQHTDRAIPPTRLQAYSTAHQLDASHRATAEWQRARGKWSTTVRGAWFDERLDWYASSDADRALSRSRTLIAEGEARFRPGGAHTLDLGMNNTFARAFTDGYPEEPRQNRTAGFVLYRFQPDGKRFVGTASMRQEWVAGRAVPLTGSLGAEYRLKTWATVKGQAARVYRIPTFNDLYWQPGGNRQLLPEDGYSADLGLVLRYARERISVSSEITGYARELENWIIWLPGPAYWSPRNIMQVLSRGVESNTELRYKHGRNTFRVGVITDHVVSTNQVATSPSDDSVDRQLIYVPMYSGNAHLGWTRHRSSLTLSTTYTGYRYTSTDNIRFLEPYWLLNAAASFRLWTGPHWQADLSLQADNLLDTEYEMMLSRPMPGRSYRIGLRVHFDRPDPPKTAVP
ncbi:MAG TPA: TonB-dependent receptor [Flavobacteriales bacterium]